MSRFRLDEESVDGLFLIGGYAGLAGEALFYGFGGVEPSLLLTVVFVAMLLGRAFLRKVLDALLNLLPGGKA